MSVKEGKMLIFVMKNIIVKLIEISINEKRPPSMLSDDSPGRPVILQLYQLF